MFNNNSQVSIITPCYNSGRFISQAINSVLVQTYPHWELFIIDDCSTDDSISIIEEYLKKDNRIKLYRTQLNTGSPVEPRNIGLKKAEGRYIAFLDSDDIWLPTKLENQIKLFDNNDIAIVFSWYEKINETGIRNDRIIVSPRQVTYRQLLKGNCIGCLTAVYDTEKVGKCYFSSIGHEDYAYWLSMLKTGYIARSTNSVEALYRLRDNSVSRNKAEAAKWTWSIYREYLNLNLIQSSYYYCFYFLKAIFKHIK